MSLHPILFSLLTPGEFEKTIINKRELTEKKKKKSAEKNREIAQERPTEGQRNKHTQTDGQACRQADRIDAFSSPKLQFST